MPFISSQASPTYYGSPGYAVPLPLAKQSDVVRATLARDRQQYDPHINYANYSFDYAQEMPELNMYDGLSGVRGKGRNLPRTIPYTIPDTLPGSDITDQFETGMGAWRNVKGAPLPTYPRTIPPTYDNEVEFLNMSVGIDPGIYSTGVAGLGIPPRPTIPQKPQQVTMNLPAPVMSSTKVAVIGGAALFVGASIALFLYVKSKKGGK